MNQHHVKVHNKTVDHVGRPRVPIEQKPHDKDDRRARGPAEAQAEALPRPGETRTRHGMGDFVLVIRAHRFVSGLERRDLFAGRRGGRIPQGRRRHGTVNLATRRVLSGPSDCILGRRRHSCACERPETVKLL